MTEAESAGSVFEGIVAQTKTLADETDDLLEALAYDGVTDEDIETFVASFVFVIYGLQYMSMFCVPANPLFGHKKASMAIDIHICGTLIAQDVEQPPSMSDADRTMSTRQNDPVR
ncbi:hypothetical protein D6C84_08926 [Aureobasidium pullulans]|uniref:Uncharacterized protein n=1 Tax=Aureobasidium pullulans TaxID=5580 RepID=A0A4S8SKB7_AURPU|nr:hypothetical protein D6D28_04770 [Aureobasidium pullulans]THZ76022.1 hypothetical protein D6C84_08926 [Aureobasidium pullulans]